MTSKPNGMGLGITLGAALGAALGMAAGHLAIGMAIGGGLHNRAIECSECTEIHRQHESRNLRQQS